MNHQNDERTVRCPVEGCDATPLARGVNLHVNRSSGGGHGPRGEVPEHISFDNLETVGSESVEMDYPDERDTDNTARLCPYCNQTFAGVQGLMIHLGQKKGRDNHPANPKDRHKPGDFPRVEVDAEGNVRGVVESPTDSTDSPEKGAVPEARVFSLIADLVADGETQTASRVRQALIGAENADAPGRGDPAHPDLYQALLTQGRADQPYQWVSVTLMDLGVKVTCRGETAVLDAGQARDIAARLEQVVAIEGWGDGDTRDLIEFLRRGAAVLDGDKTESEFDAGFDHWR